MTGTLNGGAPPLTPPADEVYAAYVRYLRAELEASLAEHPGRAAYREALRDRFEPLSPEAFAEKLAAMGGEARARFVSSLLAGRDAAIAQGAGQVGREAAAYFERLEDGRRAAEGGSGGPPGR